MTNIKTLLTPKLYAQGTATLTSRTGNMKIYIDRFVDNSGWRVSVDEKVGEYYDSDYKKVLPIWKITKQYDLKTVDEVIDKIKEIFAI